MDKILGLSISLLLVLTITCMNIAIADPISSSKAAIIDSACKETLHQTACKSALLSISSSKTTSSFNSDLPLNPKQLFDHSLHFTMDQAQSFQALVQNLTLFNPNDQTHLADCIELLDDSLDQLRNVLNRHKTTGGCGGNNGGHSHDDVRTWLSTALTNQETCLEIVRNFNFQKTNKSTIVAKAQILSHFISNSLALYMSSEKSKIGSGVGDGGRRKLLSSEFPRWVSASERKLLETSIEEIETVAVVAKDGSGTHSTIMGAIGLVVSLAGDGRTVIHVKAGTYNENLKIPAKTVNVMLVGDGKGKTVIVGNRNAEDGSTTFRSATFAAMADGFMARDITFENNAGPAKHQAVALRVGSDKSVIYRCSIVGYQDTLYTYSKRQFYRETDIYGTVDFIFGNSAVVFQNCNIYVRKPMSNQQNYVTAQGRSDPNQNTGISIHNCRITAAGDLAPVKSQTRTFLGRPWQQYSRTVVMQSYLDDSIDPLGWGPWSGSFAIKTLYYGEYQNSGPGASTSGRVNWPSYHASLAMSEAQKFTVGSFIFGNSWLPSTGVDFDSGLVA